MIGRIKATCVLFLLFSGLAACSEPAAESLPGAPNIVIVLADDQGWRDSGAYGNPDVRTPNIDQLAGEGMVFNQAFTSTAMCSPTRQQLYTGLYPVHSGAYPQNSYVRDGTRSLVHHFQELGYRVGISGKRHYSPEDSYPFERLNASWEDESAPDMERVQEFIVREEEQPFFLVVASRQPHTPWNKGDQHYVSENLTVPGDLVDTPETRAALAEYYREVSDFDGELGQVMSMIDEAGIADNTIFIYTSEQGAMFPGGKWTLYDNGIRTAFVMRWPGVIPAGSGSDALIAYVDVVPTLVEAAGGVAPNVDGSSFLSVLKGEKATHNEYVYGVQTSLGICNGAEYPIRSVRDKRYKLIVNGNSEQTFHNNITVRDSGKYYESWRIAGEAGDESAMQRYQAYQERPAEEFFDLTDDPLEMNNLIQNSEYRLEIDRLRQDLTDWQAGQGDENMMTTERAATDHMLLAGRLKLKTKKCGGPL